MSIKSVINGDRIVTLTPQIIAQMFWNMDSNEQAIFFDCLYSYSIESIAMQLQYVATTENLSYGARSVMRKIGEYADVGLDR